MDDRNLNDENNKLIDANRILEEKVSNLENQLKRLTELVQGTKDDINTDISTYSYLTNLDVNDFPVLLFVINKDGVIIDANKLARNYTGLETGFTEQIHLSSLVNEDKKDLINTIIGKVFNSKVEKGIEIEFKKSDGGKIWVIYDIFLVKKYETNPIACCLLRDISDLKKQQEELIRIKERAEESDRVKTAFLANMSHEIRTPMNAIIGFTELLNIGDLQPEKRQEYLTTIRKKGIHLLTFIDDIIEIAKFESGKLIISKTTFELNKLMNEIYQSFIEKKKSSSKDYLVVNLNIPKGENHLYTDPGRLQQVFDNLLENALKFTEKGSIEFGYEFIDNKFIQFYVRDTGIGIPKEEHKLIFDRFKQVEETISRKQGGSGLGLPITKGIVNLLGGKIWLESSPGAGSVFYFTVPYFHEKPKKPSENGQHKIPEKVINWKDKVILVTEDELVNYKFIEAILQNTNVQLLHAENGEQAIELCKTINKIDLVLMDIKLPVMNGFEATKQIKQIRQDLPIIAQTAFSSSEELEKCLQHGCDDYIVKPIDIELLINKVNKFFNK